MAEVIWDRGRSELADYDSIGENASDECGGSFMPVKVTSGHTGKSLDQVIALSGAMLNRAKHYLGEGEEAPKGVRVQQGDRGGKFFEMGGGGGGKPEEEAGDENQPQEEAGAGPYKKKDMVIYSHMTLQGPKERLGMVDFVRPDGRIEVRDQNGGIHVLGTDEVKPRVQPKQELDERGYPKPAAPQAAQKPNNAALGPKAQAAMAEAEGLFGKLKAGQLDNPQEFVDAARRAVQVYEQEKDEIGPSANPKRAALQQTVDRDEAIRDRAKELAGKWRDRWSYAKQKGVPGEELDAVKGRMEQAGKEYMQANVRYGESYKALAAFDQPKRQPKPRQPKQARPTVQHKPGDLDREMQSPKQAFQQHQQRPLFRPAERDKPENVAEQRRRMEEAAARHRARQQPGSENKAGLSIG